MTYIDMSVLKNSAREGTREGLHNEPHTYNISYAVNSVAKEEYNLQTTVHGKLILIRCFFLM
jgi:hypothetical protein